MNDIEALQGLSIFKNNNFRYRKKRNPKSPPKRKSNLFWPVGLRNLARYTRRVGPGLENWEI
jgi:hypothetical protein